MSRDFKRVKVKHLLYALSIGAIFASSFTNAKSVNQDIQNSQKLEVYIKFTQILKVIEEQYVDEVNTTTLVNKALKGLMSNLDAHSAYMDKKSFKELNVQTKGEFGGLGIVIGMRDGALTIVAPIDDTPAFKAGIKAGDIILKINDHATIGMTTDEAVTLMRGKPDTNIELTIIRKNEPKPIVTSITRAIIKVKSVKPKIIDKNILYVHIASFDEKVIKATKEAIAQYSDTKGIILDLRNNPGGLLNQAVGLVDMFVSEGTIVSQKGREQKDDTSFKANANTTIVPKKPVVILVNGGSASASEIVSGALQDFKRAVVVGKKTFGKGSVQVIMPLGDDEGIKLTIARYYLPSGRTIQNKGVIPDIEVEMGEVKMEDNSTISIKEKDLKKHLTVELEKIDHKEKNKTREIEEKNSITKENLYKDAQLKSATDILKALIITQEQN